MCIPFLPIVWLPNQKPRVLLTPLVQLHQHLLEMEKGQLQGRWLNETRMRVQKRFELKSIGLKAKRRRRKVRPALSAVGRPPTRFAAPSVLDKVTLDVWSCRSTCWVLWERESCSSSLPLTTSVSLLLAVLSSFIYCLVEGMRGPVWSANNA